MRRIRSPVPADNDCAKQPRQAKAISYFDPIREATHPPVESHRAITIDSAQATHRHSLRLRPQGSDPTSAADLYAWSEHWQGNLSAPRARRDTTPVVQ